MERQPLRLINLKATTYSARHIPHLGFGREEATAKHVGLQGCLITAIHLRKFKLSCGCTVKDADQCAGVCVECREELRYKHNILHSEEFTPDELDWLATPCRRRHWFTCAYSFCILHSTNTGIGKLNRVQRRQQVRQKCITEGFSGL